MDKLLKIHKKFKSTSNKQPSSTSKGCSTSEALPPILNESCSTCESATSYSQAVHCSRKNLFQRMRERKFSKGKLPHRAYPPANATKATSSVSTSTEDKPSDGFLVPQVPPIRKLHQPHHLKTLLTPPREQDENDELLGKNYLRNACLEAMDPATFRTRQANSKLPASCYATVSGVPPELDGYWLQANRRLEYGHIKNRHGFDEFGSVTDTSSTQTESERSWWPSRDNLYYGEPPQHTRQRLSSRAASMKQIPRTNPYMSLPKKFGAQIANQLAEANSPAKKVPKPMYAGSYGRYSGAAFTHQPHTMASSRGLYGSDQIATHQYFRDISSSGSSTPGSSDCSGENALPPVLRSKGHAGKGHRKDQAAVKFNRVVAGLKSLGIKGELYLSVQLNNNMMTVNIDQARNLESGDHVTNAYVRISLIPDHDRRTQCKTSMITGTNEPTFNETFSFEILPEDSDKRLLVSVWHKNFENDKSCLLGCMAFRIHHILAESRTVQGWYYLLSPTVGRNKHLAMDKVTMLTYYGSIDSGMNSDTEVLPRNQFSTRKRKKQIRKRVNEANEQLGNAYNQLANICCKYCGNESSLLLSSCSNEKSFLPTHCLERVALSNDSFNFTYQRFNSIDWDQVSGTESDLNCSLPRSITSSTSLSSFSTEAGNEFEFVTFRTTTTTTTSTNSEHRSPLFNSKRLSVSASNLLDVCPKKPFFNQLISKSLNKLTSVSSLFQPSTSPSPLSDAFSPGRESLQITSALDFYSQGVYMGAPRVDSFIENERNEIFKLNLSRDGSIKNRNLRLEQEMMNGSKRSSVSIMNGISELSLNGDAFDPLVRESVKKSLGFNEYPRKANSVKFECGPTFPIDELEASPATTKYFAQSRGHVASSSLQTRSRSSLSRSASNVKDANYTKQSPNSEKQQKGRSLFSPIFRRKLETVGGVVSEQSSVSLPIMSPNQTNSTPTSANSTGSTSIWSKVTKSRSRSALAEEGRAKLPQTDKKSENEPPIILEVKKHMVEVEPSADVGFLSNHRRSKSCATISGVSQTPTFEARRWDFRFRSRRSKWARSFEALLADSEGLELFHKYCCSNYTAEYVDFWIECQRYQKLPQHQLKERAIEIFSRFMYPDCVDELNLDNKIKVKIESGLSNADIHIFDGALNHSVWLMKHNSYPDFLKSQLFLRRSKRTNDPKFQL